MGPVRRIVALLAEWRAAIAHTATTKAHTVARSRADRDERRARWAHEDESRREDEADGREETLTSRINRLDARSAELRDEGAELKDRADRQADETEIRRELDDRE